MFEEPEIQELKAASDYFAFLGRKISEQEIQSMLPFFDCDEPGHTGNALDQVCLDQDCKFKGLCCVRCQYQKHRSHTNSVYPIHTFVSQLITQLSSRKIVLEEQKRKCQQYRDVVISQLRDYINTIIEHLSVTVAQLHKYHTLFENSFENIIIKSHIIVHSLIYKKHISKDKFQRYIREGVKNVSFNKEVTMPKQVPNPANDYYSLYSTKPVRLEEKFKQEHGQVIINEQEKAYELSMDFIDEMQKVAQQLQLILKSSQDNILDSVQLHKISLKIPQFELTQLAELKQIKNQFGQKVDSVFQNVTSPQKQQKMQISIIPTINEYLQKENSNTIIDPSRQKCVLGMLFETLSNCSILKVNSLKSQMSEVSCFTPLNNELIALAARFNPYIEIYRISDKRMIQRIDTKSQQGVKCLLALQRSSMITNTSDSELKLIIGLYYDQATIQSYQLQIFRQDNKYTINQQPSGLYHKTDSTSAVTCMAELYNAEYFVAGFTSGTISIYHCENNQPLFTINFLYEKPVHGICIVEAGKLFMSFSHDRSRLHYVTKLSEDQLIHNISQVRILPNPTYQVISTDSLMDDKSTLKLTHFVCGELKEFAANESRESGLRFMRIMRDDTKQSLIDEGAISNFSDLGMQNSVKDLVVLEPRRKMGKIWVIAIGDNNKIQLWEVRRAMSQNIKLWEKDLEDFLKPINHSLVKGKLLCESQEITTIKYLDVGPKVSILKVTENPSNGRFNVMIGIVNHDTRSDVDIFDVELISY